MPFPPIDTSLPADLLESSDPMAVKYLGEVQRLELHDGDVLVVRAQGRLTSQAREHLNKIMKTIIGDRQGVKILLLEDGMDIGVISR